MNRTCDGLRNELIDFHLGELEEAKALHIAAHLGRCAPCAAALRKLELETRTYSEYAAQVNRQLAGTSSAWSRFREGLMTSGRREPRSPVAEGKPGIFRTWPARVAASLLVVLAIGAGYVLLDLREPPRQEMGTGIGGYGDPEGNRASGPSRAPDAAGGMGLQQALSAIRKAEKEYLEAIRLLNAVVEKERAGLDPRQWDEFEQKLKAIDESIVASRAEYMARPSDPELALYMLSAYNRKVELLLEMAS